MSKKYSAHNKLSWLTTPSYSSISGYLDVPKSVFFLLSIDTEGRNFYPLNSYNRIAVYFWWKKISEKGNVGSDIFWELTEDEKEYMSSLTLEDWTSQFKLALHQYFQFESCLVPNLDKDIFRLFSLDKVQTIDPGIIVDVPGEFRFLLECRDDLKRAFDLCTFSGLYSIAQWWNNDGSKLYVKLKPNSDIILASLLRHVSTEKNYIIPAFVPLLLIERADLQAAFPIDTINGLYGFIDWWENYGRVLYPELNWNCSDTLAQLQELEYVDAGIYLPRYLKQLHEQLDDLRRCFDLSTMTGIVGLINWWRTDGIGHFGRFSSPLNLDRMGFFSNTVIDGMELPTFLAGFYREKFDTISLSNSESIFYNQLLKWWNECGRFEYPIFSDLKLIFNGINRLSLVSISSDKPYGVNVIGFPQGTLGLGEDARLAGLVVESLNISGSYINAPIPGPEKTVQPEGGFPIVSEAQYSVSLFCLPPTEMIRLALEGGRYLLESNEYKIGAWPWELPHWPTSFSCVRNFVDEIWAQSEYVRNCFLKEGNTPVYKMPMAVTIPEPNKDLRKKLKLADQDFVYYLMFDGNSWLSRKNPIAGVVAFQRAFSSKEKYKNVKLLIKAMNINTHDSMWISIVELAKHDPRIVIITERMDRQELINLMKACNCFISLHRSEGFGRVIAEAMLLGQPVIATNFSGNVDFCRPDTAFLVDGELIPLHPGDYIFFEGQYWCDPDVEQAARQMSYVYENSDRASLIAKNGQALIQQDYSISAVAKFYSTRLNEIKINGYDA